MDDGRERNSAWTPDEVRWSLVLVGAESPLGLYEALWEFGRGQEQPGPPGGPRAEDIRATLRQLVDEGLVAVFRYGRTMDELVAVPDSDIDSVLGEESSWRVPRRMQDGITFETTDAGARLLASPPPGAEERLFGDPTDPEHPWHEDETGSTASVIDDPPSPPPSGSSSPPPPVPPPPPPPRPGD